MPTIQFTVNGRAARADVDASALLIDVLRGPLALTGTHNGCDTMQCGACTVLVDGEAMRSCSMLAVQAEGRQVTTVEGLAAADGSLHPLQDAFIDCARPAVRLLHAGHADVGGGAAGAQSASERGRHRRCARGQPVPLHRLRQHRRRGAEGGADAGCGSGEMSHLVSTCLARAERRAAPKPARIPSGDRLRYSADEGRS